MKITDIRTYIVHAFRCNWVFVKITTTDGIYGVGEATVETRETVVAAAIERLSGLLIGQDPFAIERHVHIINRESYWRSGVILRSALSAVEGALFDIKGKALRVPVYELLGGKYRDRVRCYANGWFTGARTPEEFASKAAATVALGFRALKFDPFANAYQQLTPEEADRAVEIVEAVHCAAGPNVELLIETHGRLDLPTAVAMSRRLERFHPTWYEEPCLPESLDALVELRRRTVIPVAAGERFYEPQRFLEALEKEALDIAQPDVCHVGGLLETKRVARAVALRGKPISPHNPSGPVCNAMTLQIAASTPNFGMLETMVTDVPWRSEVVKESLQVVDGVMLIPNSPGLGVELNDEAALLHPYEERDLRHYLGNLTDILPPDAKPWFKTRRKENADLVR